jgi:hypothetical protein
MLKLKNLSASDFPGVDEAKFNEWKRLKIKSDSELNILAFTWIGLLVFNAAVRNLAGFVVFAFYTVFVIVFGLVRSKRSRQLARELDMRRRIRAKTLGKEYKG